MTYKSELAIYAQNNFDSFQQAELQKTAGEIFENAHQILAYTEMRFYFTNEHSLDESVCEFLCKSEDSILDNLYKEFLDLENSSFTWEDINHVVERYQEQHCPRKKLASFVATNDDRFRIEQLTNKTKEEIYADAYKINFYSAVSEFLTGCHSLGDDVCEYLCKDEANVLDLLYNKYIDSDYSSVNSWDDIYDFITDEYNSGEKYDVIIM